MEFVILEADSSDELASNMGEYSNRGFTFLYFTLYTSHTSGYPELKYYAVMGNPG